VQAAAIPDADACDDESHPDAAGAGTGRTRRTSLTTMGSVARTTRQLLERTGCPDVEDDFLG
jgi:hypothetical protein